MTQRQSVACGHVGPSAARDALVALRNTEHLVKSPRVGQKVVVDLLPELLSGLESLEAYFHLHAAECPDSAVCSLAFSTLESVRTAVMVASTGKGVSARLSLERTLGHDVPDLEGCVEVCELWSRAGLGQTTELTIRDVVASVFEPSLKDDAYLVAVPPDDLAFVADPAVAVWLIRAALAGAPTGTAFVALPGELGPEITLRPSAPVGKRMALRVPSPRVVFGAVAKVAERAGVGYQAGAVPKLAFRAPVSSVRSIVAADVPE